MDCCNRKQIESIPNKFNLLNNYTHLRVSNYNTYQKKHWSLHVQQCDLLLNPQRLQQLLWPSGQIVLAVGKPVALQAEHAPPINFVIKGRKDN